MLIKIGSILDIGLGLNNSWWTQRHNRPGQHIKMWQDMNKQISMNHEGFFIKE